MLKHDRNPRFIIIWQELRYKINVFLFLSGKKPPPDVEIDGVFATNELDLRQVKVYGFDYDYTLACYKESVDHLIYNLGRETLVNKLKVNCAYRFIYYSLLKLKIVSSIHQKS